MIDERSAIAGVRQSTEILLGNYRTLLQCAEVRQNSSIRLQTDRDVLDIARAAEAIAQECAQLQNLIDKLEFAVVTTAPRVILEKQSELEEEHRKCTMMAESVAARVAMDVDAALQVLEAEYYSPVR